MYADFSCPNVLQFILFVIESKNSHSLHSNIAVENFSLSSYNISFWETSINLKSDNNMTSPALQLISIFPSQ